MSSFTKLIDSVDDRVNLDRIGDTDCIHPEPRSLIGNLNTETVKKIGITAHFGTRRKNEITAIFLVKIAFPSLF
jgi:hypothetical protein